MMRKQFVVSLYWNRKKTISLLLCCFVFSIPVILIPVPQKDTGTRWMSNQMRRCEYFKDCNIYRKNKKWDEKRWLFNITFLWQVDQLINCLPARPAGKTVIPHTPYEFKEKTLILNILPTGRQEREDPPSFDFLLGLIYFLPIFAWFAKLFSIVRAGERAGRLHH